MTHLLVFLTRLIAPKFTANHDNVIQLLTSAVHEATNQRLRSQSDMASYNQQLKNATTLIEGQK